MGVEVILYEGAKHASATGWRSTGMDLEMIRRMLRHRDSRSTKRYAKLADRALVEGFTRATA
jgi:site-specific recombinase XerD